MTRAHATALVVTLLALLYLRAYYHSPSRDMEVLQTDLLFLTDNVLLRKCPLVIVDRIQNHTELVQRSALRLLHVRSVPPRQLYSEGMSIATARFTLIYQGHSVVCNVEVRHPSTGSGALILLGQHQTLVLPPRWRYRCSHRDAACEVTVRELHDGISLALRSLGMTRHAAFSITKH